MKKILLSILLISAILSYQYYLGLFNSPEIKINNFIIKTPSQYYISKGLKNFDKLDTSCEFTPFCKKEFILPIKYNSNNIIITYEKILSHNSLSLSFTVTTKKESNIFKEVFFKNKKTLRINNCLVSQYKNEDSYNYNLQINQNNFIQINGNEKLIVEKYFNQFCN